MARRFTLGLVVAAAFLSVSASAFAEPSSRGGYTSSTAKMMPARDYRSSTGSDRSSPASPWKDRYKTADPSKDRAFSSNSPWKDRSPASSSAAGNGSSPGARAWGGATKSGSSAQQPTTRDGGTGVPYSLRTNTSVTTDPKSGAVTTTSWAKVKGVDHSLVERVNPSGRIITDVTAYKSTGAVTSRTVYTPARVVAGKSFPSETVTRQL